MALAQSGDMPTQRPINEHTLDQSHYMVYHPTRGICLIPEDELLGIKWYGTPQRFEGNDSFNNYQFTWFIGEVHVMSTEGGEVISFTDIIKINMP